MAKTSKNKTTKKKKKTSSPAKENLLYKYAQFWLILAVLIVYAPTLNMGFTELDDTIFIKEMSAYNSEASNLFTSFTRGVFSEKESTYYRPFLLNSFIINAFFSKQNITGYHFVNILLHLLAVLLLFGLLQKLSIKKRTAFWLSMIFAVHVVLSQAVSWIPGRNDSLLGVFVFSFFISMINYFQTGKSKWLIWQGLALLAALFTKETAVFAIPIAWLIGVFLPKRAWKDRFALTTYGLWAGSAVIYLLARSQANLEQGSLFSGDVFASFFNRLPVLIAYLGKIFLPFNLSVFPMAQDMTLIYGLIAFVGLGVLIYLSRKNNWRLMIVGGSMFALFLIPALLVPDAVNNQEFEHRLYLPMVGILLLLSETLLFKNQLSERQFSRAAGGIVVLLAVWNLVRQPVFDNAINFWTEAVETSPNSAYANMMLAARLDDTDMTRANTLMQKAYKLDPDQKYINYYLGSLKVTEGKLMESESFFLKEIENSNYYKCYEHLAQIAFQRKDLSNAISYLENYLAVDGNAVEMQNNLLMLYAQTNQIDKLKDQAAKMKLRGLTIPAEFNNLLSN